MGSTHGEGRTLVYSRPLPPGLMHHRKKERLPPLIRTLTLYRLLAAVLASGGTVSFDLVAPHYRADIATITVDKWRAPLMRLPVLRWRSFQSCIPSWRGATKLCDCTAPCTIRSRHRRRCMPILRRSVAIATRRARPDCTHRTGIKSAPSPVRRHLQLVWWLPTSRVKREIWLALLHTTP